MNKIRMSLFLVFILLTVGTLFANVITIGTGTSATYEPIASYYGYHRSAAIYTSAEVGGSGTINTIAYKASVTNATVEPVKIYMKMTSASSLTAATWATLTSGLTPIFDSTVSGTTSGSWKVITLTTPFVYTGTNLEILIETNYGGGGTTGPQWYYTSAANLNEYFRLDSAPPTTTGTVNSSRPNVQLDMSNYVVFAPSFGVNPASIAYGNTTVNTTTATTNVTVTNTGAGTLNITSVALGGTDAARFILDMNANPTPWALTAGQSKIVKVSFNPTDQLSYSAYLRFVGDVKVNHDVALSGTGFDPTWITFPHSESFDGTTFIPAGWANVKTAGTGTPGIWDRQTTGGSPSCSPHSGAAMTRYNSYSLASGTKGILVTPSITVPGNDYRVVFWFYRDSSSSALDLMNVYFNTVQSLAGTPTLLGTINRGATLAPVVGTSGWYQYSYNFPAGSAGTGKYVVFEAVSAYGNNMFLDDVTVEQQPAIPAAALLVSPADAGVNILRNATLNWAPNGAGSLPTGYKVYFGTSATPTNMVSDQTGTSYIPSLNYGTTYYWQIVPYTGATNAPSCPIWSFTTMADPTITAFPYTEGFDGTTFPPTGWANYGKTVATGAITGDAFWSRLTSGTYSSTPGVAKVAYNHSALVDACLEMPPVNLPNNYGLTFYWRDADSKIAGHDYTYCEISIDGGTSWTILATLAAPAAETAYTQVSIDLSPYAGDRRLIRWRDNTDAASAAYGTFLDGIKIEDSATPPMDAITPTPATNATNVAINPTLIWVNGGGIPTGYRVYMDQDPDPSTLVSDQVGTSYPVTPNLLFGTTYNWKVVAYNTLGDSPNPAIWTLTTTSGITTTPSPAIAAIGVQATARTLSWSSISGATSYKLNAGTFSGGSDLVNKAEVTTNSYTYSANWPYSTTIYWRVTTLNGEQEVQGTEWTFTTIADPTLIPPYTQDFAGTFLPANWSKMTGLLADPVVLTTTTSGWAQDDWTNVTSPVNKAAGINIYGTSSKYWLITPPINLGTNPWQLEFDLSLNKWNQTPTGTVPDMTGTDDKFAVVISTDGGATWTTANARIWNNTGSADVYNTITRTGDHVIVPLGSYSGTIAIGFYGESTISNADNDLMIDNIAMNAMVTNPVYVCAPEAKAFGSNQIGNTTAAQTFTIRNNGGGAIHFTNPISIVGADAAQFILTDANTYPISLGTNQTAAVQVAFHPTSEGAKSASLRIVDDMAKTEHLYPLTGSGIDYAVHSFPYVQNFESLTVPNMPSAWTIIDANNDTKTWVTKTDGSNNLSASVMYNSSMPMNDWLITPPVTMTAGITYQVKFSYRAESETYAEGMELKFGDAPNAAALTNLLWSNTSIDNTTHAVAMATVTPTTTGTYYLGWHGISATDMYYLYLDNIRITLPGNDVVTAYGSASGGSATITTPELINPITLTPFTTTVGITGITGAPTINVTAAWAPGDVTVPNTGLVFTLAPTTGFSLGGTTLTITHNLGFIPLQIGYRVLPSTGLLLINNPGSWTTTEATLLIPGAKAAGDVQVVFPQTQDEELPVELTSFSAVLSAEYYVSLAWTSQSETNHLGYNMLRSTTESMQDALKINSTLISEGMHSGTMTNYTFTDDEVNNETTYYYWLESLDLNGSSTFFGPLNVLVTNPGTPDTPPIIPVVTKLGNAFPNPFYSDTHITYDLKVASDVKIEVYNVKGQHIKTLENSHREANSNYPVVWSGTDDNGNEVSTGIYFIRMSAGKYQKTTKVILMK